MSTRFLSKRLDKLAPYVPGEQPRGKSFIKLNTNESPYDPSPLVLKAISERAICDQRLYCDPTGLLLKEALAFENGVKPENIVLSNGSDEVLSFAFFGLCENGAAFADITYGFYPVFCRLYGINYNAIPLKDDFSMDIQSLNAEKKTLVIANPNAPTGIYLGNDVIEELLLHDSQRLVIVDEAYIDFGGKSCVSLLDSYDNLLVVRTFSKSRSLAGARVGYAIGNKELISDLERIRSSINPYNVSMLSLLAAEAATKDGKYYADMCKKIMSTRSAMENGLLGLGFTLTDSKANFVFAKHPQKSGDEVYAFLRENGILARHFTTPRTEDYLRITVGTDEQIATLLQVLKKL